MGLKRDKRRNLTTCARRSVRRQSNCVASPRCAYKNPANGRVWRTVTPCSNCRQQKIKCVTSEHPPVNPCSRCQRKGLRCEYPVPAHLEHEYISTNSSAASTFDQRYPSHALDVHPSQHHYSNPSPGAVPSLPYTGPPQGNPRPRYSGTNAYPNLQLTQPDYAYPQAYRLDDSRYYPPGPPSTFPGPEYSRIATGDADSPDGSQRDWNFAYPGPPPHGYSSQSASGGARYGG
ncbi:Glycoside hydrolase family 31 protein [Mycena chlorophos]|uniref:Glycoside hydrolase family 31 protein n=1 Tax=Mycena chlorophos TaxID=658473 RepID=A0A8H6T934_MYCCL|nr:Glycoside hydrolase family 31 protein [Mycena chlorophos]